MDKIKLENVATFGCSWTAGVGTEYYSWAQELARENPYITVRNYGMGGTSLKWSITRLLAFKQYNPHSHTVLQVTVPNRITLSNQCTYDSTVLSQMSENYSNSNMHPEDHILTFQPTKPPKYHPNYTLAQRKCMHTALYDSHNHDVELLEWKMYIDYAVANSNLVYFHNIYHMERYIALGGTKLPCVEEHFGESQFNEWVYDGGQHLHIQGSQEVARWVKATLKI